MILELKNIEKSFGEKKVLTGVSFKAEGGKAFGLLGRNGAGKTTSIRILMDVFPAGSGEVLIDGKPINYNKVGIGDGLQFIDEPFSGLDPVNAMLLKDVVKEQISKGKIVLFSSHQMSYIEEFCDSIAIINAGKVVLTGDLHDIKRDYPRDRLVVRTEYPEQIQADFGTACKVMENSALLIQLFSPEEKKAVMARLIEHYDIDEVKVYEPSLNDIFVEYAGDTAAEG